MSPLSDIAPRFVAVCKTSLSLILYFDSVKSCHSPQPMEIVDEHSAPEDAFFRRVLHVIVIALAVFNLYICHGR